MSSKIEEEFLRYYVMYHLAHDISTDLRFYLFLQKLVKTFDQQFLKDSPPFPGSNALLYKTGDYARIYNDKLYYYVRITNNNLLRIIKIRNVGLNYRDNLTLHILYFDFRAVQTLR